MNLTQKLPADIKAEEGMLVAIVYDNSLLDTLEITEAYFHGVKTREAINAILSIHKSGRVVNYATLGEVMGFDGAQSVCMGYTFWNPDHAYRILKKRKIERDIVVNAHQLVELLMNGKSLEDSSVQSVISYISTESVDEDVVTVAEAEVTRNEFLQKKIAARSEGKRYTGDETGFPFLDRVMDGLQPASYVVVVGQSSAGKSAFINNLSAKLIQDNKRIEMLTYEMTPETYNTRLLSIISKVPYYKIDRGLLSKDESAEVEKAVGIITSARFQYRTNNSYNHLLRTLKSLESSDVDYVFIDYLQNIDTPDEREYMAYKKLSLTIRSWTRKTKKTIVLVSQMSNENINNIKKNESQAKGAGDVKAHCTQFIELSNYHDKEETKKREEAGDRRSIMITLDKNQVGRTGRGYYLYQGDNYEFEEVDESILKSDTGSFSSIR